jgi:hypothetical protein
MTSAYKAIAHELFSTNLSALCQSMSIDETRFKVRLSAAVDRLVPSALKPTGCAFIRAAEYLRLVCDILFTRLCRVGCRNYIIYYCLSDREAREVLN